MPSVIPGLPGDFLFLDESGDLGLSPRSTPYLVVGILHLRAEDCLKRIAKRVRAKKLRKAGPLTELKWSNTNPAIRVAMLEQIVKAGDLVAGVSACVMSKGWLNRAHASRESAIRYNYAARLAMERGRLFDETVRKRVVLTIDERNIAATTSMREHLAVLKDAGELCCEVDLRSRKSHEVPALQAADFVVGAVAAGYALGEWKYVNLLKKGGIKFAVRTPGWKPPGKKNADSPSTLPI